MLVGHIAIRSFTDHSVGHVIKIPDPEQIGKTVTKRNVEGCSSSSQLKRDALATDGSGLLGYNIIVGLYIFLSLPSLYCLPIISLSLSFILALPLSSPSLILLGGSLVDVTNIAYSCVII